MNSISDVIPNMKASGLLHSLDLMPSRLSDDSVSWARLIMCGSELQRQEGPEEEEEARAEIGKGGRVELLSLPLVLLCLE